MLHGVGHADVEAMAQEQGVEALAAIGSGLSGNAGETAAVPHQNGVGAHGLGQLGVLDVHLERCRAAHSTEVS